MIRVEPQAEPDEFDASVRQKGRAWLQARGLPLAGPKPEGVELPPYWRACLPDLHRKYGGICAYVCIDIPSVTGARSVDHFVAKSGDVGQAYEWANYRLACSIMNSRKREFDDVLDPFEVPNGTFEVELVSGRIHPRQGLLPELAERAAATIERLGLDEQDCREARTTHYTEYIQGHISADYFRRKSPFVWSEVVRQNATRPEDAQPG